MATSSILLPIGAAVLPDGSSGNAAPAILRVQGTETNPKKHVLVGSFDASTEEFMYWTFQLPHQAAAAPTFTVRVNCTSTTAATATTIAWGARISAVTAADTDTPVEHAQVAQRTVVLNNNQTEAGRLIAGSIAFTNAQADGAVPDDLIFVQVSRVVASDDLAEDARLWSVALDYDLA